jgi:hypothetical protein
MSLLTSEERSFLFELRLTQPSPNIFRALLLPLKLSQSN